MTRVRDEISLRDLWRAMLRQRLLFVALAVAGAVIGGVSALLQPDLYEATVTISPIASSSNSNRLSGVLPQIGGLASLAGLSLGNDTNKADTLAVLQSEALTERFILDNGIVRILYANDWRSAAGRWLGLWGNRPPSLWEASRQFKSIRMVVDDKKTGLTTLSVVWKVPEVAAKWANDLVQRTNNELRAKAVVESERHIAYLTEQAAKTDIAQARTAIYAILESEIKSLMLAKGPGDFALRVLDPAIAPERKSSPIRSLWVLAGGFSGFFVALSFVLFRDAWRSGATDSKVVVRS